MQYFLEHIDFRLFSFLVFSLSAVVTYKMIPKIIGVVRFKRLMEKPNNRSSHQNETPTLGGVAFFGSIMISMFLIRIYDVSEIGYNIITALTILFLMGMKDDLVVLSARSKVILQSLAIVLIISHPDIVVMDLHGFLGIGKLPYFLSFILSFLAILYILNAFNLIDGIDGLAGLLGLVMSSIFAIMFYNVSQFFYSLLALMLFAFLLPFLRYNFSRKEKIFMGDTGSMIVGFLIAILALKFMNLSDSQFNELNISPHNALIVTVSIIFFPVIDVIRVVIIRLINKREPFSPDRSHLHHILIDKGISHRKASITLTFSSILSFLIIYGLNSVLGSIELLIVFIIFTILTFYILLLLDQNPQSKKYRKVIKSHFPEKLYLLEFKVRKRIIIILKSLFYKDLI